MWNRLKNKKSFYIFVSILIAVICWFYVDLTVEPEINVKVRNIPVTYEGMDELDAKGLMLEEGADATVTLRLSGKRGALSQLNKNNVMVTVDAASQISGPGEQSLEYTVDFPSTVNDSVQISSRSVSAIDVTVIRSTTSSVPVEGKFSGSVENGYMAGDFDLQYRSINVSGDGELVERVDHAVVTLDRSGLNSDWTGTVPVTLADKSGNVLEDDRLELSHDEMEITMEVRRVKELPLTVTIQDGGGATAEDVVCEIEPERVRIAGTDEDLRGLKEWNLGTVDLSQVITSEKRSLNLDLPSGLRCVSGEESATVSIKLPKLTTVKMKTTNFEFINVPKTKNASLQEHSLEVRIRGSKKALDLLVSDDILVQVDLDELDDNSYGSYTVPAKVTLRGFTEIGPVGTYEMPVYVS